MLKKGKLADFHKWKYGMLNLMPSARCHFTDLVLELVGSQPPGPGNKTCAHARLLAAKNVGEAHFPPSRF